jgi:HSP90 family molecular chaperone
MSEKKELYFEPYARLLTMLSEQLIKNEVVALTEVVKNAYDADSPWVKITFEKFNSNMVASKNSRIIIEDAGCGMSESTLKNDFINPASAHKKIEKEAGNTTPMGRIYQGEKGIGRFSLFKLGKKLL